VPQNLAPANGSPVNAAGVGPVNLIPTAANALRIWNQTRALLPKGRKG